ncbi:MAG: TerC family protein [Nitrospirae bacterium]|nr:TerC family protein [Nitrospirota bacterium]
MLDLGSIGKISFDINFIYGFLSIIVIDLILAGDNAIVIAMAVRSLPPQRRKKGIILGAGAAVLLRIILTFFVAQLLQINYLKLAGGVLILWIAVKLFMEGVPEDSSRKEAKTLMQAMKLIVVADITMSTDNMLAVAGASHGNLFLLLFGLSLSIPFVVFTSNLLSMLMDKYPIIIYFGAAILGTVGGEMMITDPVIVNWLNPGKALIYSAETFFALGVIAAGKLWMKWNISKEEQKEQIHENT